MLDVTQPPFNAGRGGDDTTKVQDAIDFAYKGDRQLTRGCVYFPPGEYVVDPRVGLKLRDNVSLRGAGWSASQIVALDDYEGRLLRKHPDGDRTQQVVISDLRIVLRGDGQTAIDLTDVGRSTVRDCYVTVQTRQTEFDNQPKTIMGTGVVLGFSPGGDYGNGCTVKDCFVYFMRVGVRVDKGYSHLIDHCDIMEGNTLIDVRSATEVAMLRVTNCTLQFLHSPTEFAVDLTCHDSVIENCYFELGRDSPARGCLLFRSGSKRNVARTNGFYADPARWVCDEGEANRVEDFGNE